MIDDLISFLIEFVESGIQTIVQTLSREPWLWIGILLLVICLVALVRR